MSLLYLLIVFPPIMEVPIFEHKAQLLTAAQTEFIEDMLQMRFHCLWCNNKSLSDLIISVPETDQRDNLLFSM